MMRTTMRTATTALTLLLLPLWTFAQTKPTVTTVTLYPSGATVERLSHAGPGIVELQFDCLPASLAAQSVHAQGDPSLRIGEVRLTPVTASRTELCRRGQNADRVKSLEDQKAAIAAENDANELAADFLKKVATTEDSSPNAHNVMTLDPTRLAAVTDGLRKEAQTVFDRRQAIKHRMEEIDREIALAHDDPEQAGTGTTDFRAAKVSVQSERGGDVSLVYQVARAGWSPAYRVSLDSSNSKLVIERNASIAQTTGENWTGVHLRLSTGQPSGTLQPNIPQPWILSVAEPPRVDASGYRMQSAPAPVAAPMAVFEKSTRPSANVPAPIFDVAAFEGVYSTEFDIPVPVSLSSDGQRLAVTLVRQSLPATLIVRTVPKQDSGAYLIAELDRPSGIWPRGPLQIERDNAYVGSIPSWLPASMEKLQIPLGRDDQVEVKVIPVQTNKGSAGLLSTRVERQYEDRYEVRNGHKTAIALEVLEPIPISIDEAIEVKRTFAPAIATESWNEQKGIAQWTASLGAGQTLTFDATYVVTYAKDTRVNGL